MARFVSSNVGLIWPTIRKRCVALVYSSTLIRHTCDTAPPAGTSQYFSKLLPAALTNGRGLGSRGVFVSNDKHGNTKLVQTGFVLIFQCILQKHSFALFLRHITRKVDGCRRSSLRKKAHFYGHIFVSLLCVSFLQNG